MCHIKEAHINFWPFFAICKMMDKQQERDTTYGAKGGNLFHGALIVHDLAARWTVHEPKDPVEVQGVDLGRGHQT
jgi:hypothetical protein